MGAATRHTRHQSALSTRPFGAHAPSFLWRMLIGRADLGRAASVGAGRAKWLRRRLSRARPVFDITYRDLKLRLYPGENVCDRSLAIHGTHTSHKDLEPAADALASARVFVDIGANVGFFTLVARSMMPTGARVYAFEPDPRTVEKLHQNLALNGAGDDVIVFNAGVGPAEETLTLYAASRNNAGRYTMVPNLSRRGEGVDVPVRPLLSVLTEARVTAIDVLKIDIEGFEDSALGPFLAAAPDTMLPRHIMVEVKFKAEWKTDLIAQILSLGYDVVFENDQDMHFRRVQPAADPQTPPAER